MNEGLDGAAHGEHGHDLFYAELLRIKGDIPCCAAVSVTAAEDLFQCGAEHRVPAGNAAVGATCRPQSGARVW